VAFRCPYCSFRITVKTPPKPGRYTPSCPKCKGKLALTVPADAAVEWTTAKIAGENPVIPQEPEATAANIPASPPPKKKPAPVTNSFDATEATGNFGQAGVGDATEATGDFGRVPPAHDQTAVQGTSDESPDQTAAFGMSDKTRAGDGDGNTIAHTEAGESPPKKTKKKKEPTQVEIPETLGGYEVVKELGRGGMGAVYLARQVSLDRSVALKVMNTKWASDPIFLARFTREAYAAAQLVHHNVVQIYDIGEQQGINFFSMEFVEGKSLGDLLRKDGKVDVQAAIGYIMQAARGLKFAHDRGMIHRDVKPDNLMLNVHGIVKVADLGLVKTPAMTAEDDALPERAKTDPDLKKSMSGLRSLPSDITMAHTAMGSPAYMSPEQCKNAAAVDSRADIYSLGCTLYALLSGKPPFQGSNVFDVMAKHATEPPAPISGVPKEVNACVMKSLAKEPGDRQQTMDEYVAELEKVIPGKGASGPSEEHLSSLEACVQKFQSARMGKIRKALIPAFFLGCTLAAIIGLFVGGGIVTAALVGLMLETTLAYFVIDGMFGKSYVFRRTREWALGARLGDWAIGSLGLIVMVLVLWMVGLLWVWLGTAVLAVAIAFLFHFIVDRSLTSQRRSSVEDCEKMLKRLRLVGMDEEALRLFVAKNAGRSWEAFFEAVFGFESKLTVRPTVEEQAGSKLPHHAAWRETLLARIEKALQARRDAKARKLIQKVETKKLEAQGVDRKEAASQAEAAAEVIVEQAAEIKAAKKKPINVRAMLDRTEKAPKRLPKPAGYKLKKMLGVLSGFKFRFVAGLLLIALGALWVRAQIKLDQVAQAAGGVTSAKTDDASQEASKQAASSLSSLMARQNPLTLPLIGTTVNWVDCLNPLVAGLIVVLSAFNRRGLGIALQLGGAAIALFGHLAEVIPAIGPVEPHQLTMAVAVGLAALGVFVARK